MPTATPAPDWQVYTNHKYGFKVAIPTVLWVDPELQPLPQSGSSYVSFDYKSSSQSQIADIFMPNGSVTIYASPAPAQCNLRGTPMPVGGGITGYRDDNYTHPPTSGAYVPGGSVSFITGGLYVSIFIAANGRTSASAYWTDFGPAWQHILASFVPGPVIPGAHPCG